jgi:hypothetical protein
LAQGVLNTSGAAWRKKFAAPSVFRNLETYMIIRRRLNARLPVRPTTAKLAKALEQEMAAIDDTKE